MAKLDLPLIVVGGSPGFYGVQCSSSTVVCLILTQKATGESVIFLLSEDTTLQRGGSVFIFRISTVDKLLTMRRNLCLLCIWKCTAVIEKGFHYSAWFPHLLQPLGFLYWAFTQYIFSHKLNGWVRYWLHSCGYLILQYVIVYECSSVFFSSILLCSQSGDDFSIYDDDDDMGSFTLKQWNVMCKLALMVLTLWLAYI